MINNQFDSEMHKLADLAQKIKQANNPEQTKEFSDYLNLLNDMMKNGWQYALGRIDEIGEVYLPKQYVVQRNQVIRELQIKLGRCAEKYRSALEGTTLNKKAISEYHKNYEELVRINGGIIALDPDSELPDKWMPKEYLEFWLQGS